MPTLLELFDELEQKNNLVKRLKSENMDSSLIEQATRALLDVKVRISEIQLANSDSNNRQHV